MSLEDKYKTSKNINTKPYSRKTKFNIDRSDLNIDSIPKKYNPKSKNNKSTYGPK
jgi:hypothetical protein